MSIGCVIMAAGQGRRFGRNKLLEPLAGKPLLAHVLDALPRACFQRLTAVVSCPETAVLCHARHIPTVVNELGILSQSVRLGVKEMEGLDGCLFVMGDQPLCSTASIQRMVDAFQAHPGCVFRLACQDCVGSPVLFPRSAFPALAALTGEQGGMAAVRGRDVEIRLVQAVCPAELWDADTPQALETIRSYLQSKG